METAVDIINRIQGKILQRQQEAMETNTLSTLNADGETLYCKHGYEIREGHMCYECIEDEQHEKWNKSEKEKYAQIAENPAEKLKQFNIPPKYLNCSFDTFIGNDKAVKECRAYKSGGLVLYGNTGCGKTHLAVSIMREWMINEIKGLIARDWGKYYCDISKHLFKTVPDMLLEIRESFKDNSSETESGIIDRYSKIPFLVLDDLGSEKTSEYAITTLYIIIDRRDRELLPTVITTNLSPIEIEEKLSARIASRLSGMKNIKINMPDYRKKR